MQLYAIIAIVVKDLVHSWYGKITPDQTFVEEVIKIIAHCTTQLESRLRKVDLESLVLDEIPELVERHVNGTSNHSGRVICQLNEEYDSISSQPSKRASGLPFNKPAKDLP